jgi:hypothetical protein
LPRFDAAVLAERKRRLEAALRLRHASAMTVVELEGVALDG